MTLGLVRIYNCPTYCIGKMYVNGEWVCDTIEECDRGLEQTMSGEEIERVKYDHHTAVPTGTYKVGMDVKSPLAHLKFYAKFCNGRLPVILNIPLFDDATIHCGASAANPTGSVIVGYNTIKGCVTDSRKAWERLMKPLLKARKEREKIEITIIRKYKEG